MKKLTLTLLCCLCAIVATAASYSKSGLTFTDENGTTWTYTTYGDTDTEKYNSTITSVSNLPNEVVVPNSFIYEEIEYPVTSIGTIFKSNGNITSVTILEGVTWIASRAFSGCSSLTSVTIPEGVTGIGPYAFELCSSLTSVTIPESVTSIARFAFDQCSSLKNIYIDDIAAWCNLNIEGSSSNPLRKSNMNLYLNGELITDLVIPQGVTNIREGAFLYCSSLTSVTIPESVTSIGNNAFSGCYSLTSVTIPGSVTSIGNNAFYNCSSLTSVTIPGSVTSIGGYAFQNCSSLTSVTIPESVTSIGNNAFSGCYSLTSVTIPGSVTSIGNNAFYNCSSLKNIYIDDIAAWCNLNIEGSDSNPLRYSNMNLYLNGELITDLEIPQGVTNIREEAFKYCSSLTSVTIPESVTSIGNNAFYNCSSLTLVKMGGSNPPSLQSSSFSESTRVFVVPNRTSYENYCAHADWQNHIIDLTYEDVYTQSVALVANDNVSALYTAIGEENLKFVYDLTIEGTINGADIYMIRNKMPALRKLDLSNARIVSGGGAYYNSYTTQDDILGDYAFWLLKLSEIKLPKQLTSIKAYAFSGCSKLRLIEIQKGVTSIGSNAFYGCSSLTSVTIPEGVTSIGSSAFYNCSNLTSVTMLEGMTSIGRVAFYQCSNLKDVVFPRSLKQIEDEAFYKCTKLEKIILPVALEAIGENAFRGCTSLKEVRFPSGLKSLGSSVFNSCSAITDVYAYTIEPISMSEGTFTTSVVQNATLHYPVTSKYNYYSNGGWGQFLNMEEFDEPYEYFYLNNDYVLNQNNGGVIGGTPDVDINQGGGLIVEDDLNGGEDDTQHSNDMNIHHNGGHGNNGVAGSIIANGNLHANKLHFHINVTANKWHFFSFPFNVKRENIKLENGSDWVFYAYDGEVRASNGKGGWKHVSSEDGQGNFLKAGMGYIFQSSKNDVLIITVDEDDNTDEKGIRVEKNDKSNALETHASQNEQDASWNFMGNPHLSYYNLDTDTYNAPITVWDGSKYVAVRPGDDDYQLAPFQAFFVQKPEGVKEIEFDGDNLMTHHQKENHQAQAATYARSRSNGNRLIVNVSLSDGNEKDETRVVFNNAQKMNYEMACDAAKFASDDVPQLYTLDSRKVKYAINERPQEDGTVPMGYSVPAYGSYTIDAPRMDTPMMLKDLQTGIIHDFNEGSYEFASEAGTFDNRFVLTMKYVVTGMDEVTLGNIKVTGLKGAIEVSQLGDATLNVFTASGEKVATCLTDGQIAVTTGVYVVEANGKSVKVIVK